MRRRRYRGNDVGRALDIEDLRHMARKRLPSFVTEYVDGGAEDEVSLRDNRDVFERHRFVSRVLVDLEQRDRSTEIFGVSAGMPCAIAPTGFNGLLWRHADIALAKAAAAHQIPFTIATVSSDSMEAIAKEAGGRLWFQLYVLRDDKAVSTLLEHADGCGCEALVVTLDAPVLGNRTWDRRMYTAPLKLSWRARFDVLRRWRWLFNVLLPKGLPGFPNLGHFLPPNQQSVLDGARYMQQNMNPALSWSDIERLRERWPRRLILKGLLAAADVARARSIGADGVVLSNHGGRQLDGAISSLDVLPAAVQAAAGEVSVFIDGGVRRGSDIAKAVALGADGVLLGRATLYGVAAGGQSGAQRALDILAEEIDRVLALVGCPRLRELDSEWIATPPAGAVSSERRAEPHTPRGIEGLQTKARTDEPRFPTPRGVGSAKA